jgi:hypothetical protein
MFPIALPDGFTWPFMTVSDVYVYSLSTVGTTNMLNVGSTGIVKQSNNRNGFASTMTIWTSTTSTH